MNITETKTKEQRVTDLILGTGEINKDTTEIHGKATLTMELSLNKKPTIIKIMIQKKLKITSRSFNLDKLPNREYRNCNCP